MREKKRDYIHLVLCPAGISHDSIRLNPGYKLYEWLNQRYRIDRSGQEETWLNKASADFGMLSLEDMVYESSMLMILRKLMATADYYRRMFNDTDVPFDVVFEEKYLRNHFPFNDRECRKISNLVIKSLTTSRQEITSYTTKRLLDRHEAIDGRCYLCGGKIDFKLKDAHNAFSLDHLWPQSLGGSSDEFNLLPACRRCNGVRQDMVSFADSHYEHFNIKSLRTDDGFDSELRRTFRMGVMFRALGLCEQCGTKIGENGSANILPREREDSLSAFNSMLICKDCNK